MYRYVRAGCVYGRVKLKVKVRQRIDLGIILMLVSECIRAYSVYACISFEFMHTCMHKCRCKCIQVYNLSTIYTCLHVYRFLACYPAKIHGEFFAPDDNM